MYIYLYNNSKTNVNSIRRLTGAKDNSNAPHEAPLPYNRSNKSY